MSRVISSELSQSRATTVSSMWIEVVAVIGDDGLEIRIN
jgi:hypothetical protein